MTWLVLIILICSGCEAYKAYLKHAKGQPARLEERLASLESEVRQLRELVHDAVIAESDAWPRRMAQDSSRRDSVDAG